MTGLAEGGPAGDEHAGARQARGQLAAVDGGVGGPQEVGLAVGDLEVALAQRGGQRARSSVIARTRSASSSEQLRSASSAPAWETSETPRSGASSARRSSEPGPPRA